MLMIRFQRIGRVNDAAFRIVVLEKERAAKTGRITDLVGTYNPKSKAMTLDAERVKEWIAKGAQVSPSLMNLLINKGILEGKKVNVLPKKTSQKKEEEVVIEPAAPVADVAAPVAQAEEAPAAEVATPEAPVAAEEVVAEELAAEVPEEAKEEVKEAPTSEVGVPTEASGKA